MNLQYCGAVICRSTALLFALLLTLSCAATPARSSTRFTREADVIVWIAERRSQAEFPAPVPRPTYAAKAEPTPLAAAGFASAFLEFSMFQRPPPPTFF